MFNLFWVKCVRYCGTMMIRDDTISVEMCVYNCIRCAFNMFGANEYGHAFGIYTVYLNTYFVPSNKTQ